jgi:hypothetical protein
MMGQCFNRNTSQLPYTTIVCGAPLKDRYYQPSRSFIKLHYSFEYHYITNMRLPTLKVIIATVKASTVRNK